MSQIDMEKLHREQVRWRILNVLNAGRPFPTNEALVLQVMHDSSLMITPHELRRELDYLEDRKLVIIQNRHSPMWSAELTHYGVDIVEYTTDCFPGIARPKKWF